MSKTIFIRVPLVALPLILGFLSPGDQFASAAPAAETSQQDPSGGEKEEKKSKKAQEPKAESEKETSPKRRSKQQQNRKDETGEENSGAEAQATVTVMPAPEETSPAPEEEAQSEYLRQLSEEVTLLTLERDKLVAENTIAREKVVKELSGREAATELLEMETEEIEAAMKLDALRLQFDLEKELNDLRAEKERLVLNAEIAKAKSDAEISNYKVLEEERKSRLSQLSSEIEEKEKQMERKNYAEQSPTYLENPLQGKTLVISDRRIALNGLISSETAEYVSERINYFNNKDRKMPIFIVIDYSQGGSVMSGYKVLKAMQGSEAPVHVVVKSFAASMAACITTLADKSYAYPNALLLHHQISGMSSGNLTQQREFVEEAEEWWRRLAGPVAEKMGVTLDEFIEMMYENVSTGDWVEFGDKATNLKWIDHIIEEVRETSLVKNPDAGGNGSGETETSAYPYGFAEQVDEAGKPFVNLPRLAPFDYYWLYNPDGYYR